MLIVESGREGRGMARSSLREKEKGERERKKKIGRWTEKEKENTNAPLWV